MYLQNRDKAEIRDSRAEIYHFFKSVDMPENEKRLQETMELIRMSRQVIFAGIGTSGILGNYGARMFANVNKFSLCISDPFYSITDGMAEDVVGAFNIMRKYIAVSGMKKEMSVIGLSSPEIIKVAV